MPVSRKKKAESPVQEEDGATHRKSTKGKTKSKQSATTPRKLSNSAEAQNDAKTNRSSLTPAQLQSQSRSNSNIQQRGVTELASRILTGKHISFENADVKDEGLIYLLLLRYRSESSVYMVEGWEEAMLLGIGTFAVACGAYFAYNYLAAWTH